MIKRLASRPTFQGRKVANVAYHAGSARQSGRAVYFAANIILETTGEKSQRGIGGKENCHSQGFINWRTVKQNVVRKKALENATRFSFNSGAHALLNRKSRIMITGVSRTGLIKAFGLLKFPIPFPSLQCVRSTTKS